MVRLMLVVALALSLAACGGGSDGLSRGEEKELEALVAAAEAAKAQADAARAEAEAARAEAEAARIQAEAEKAQAEAEVQHQLREAQAARQAAESARREAETALRAAEAAARAAEAARGETRTVEAERDRLAAEAREAEQRVTQAEAQNALSGLQEATTSPPPAAVTPRYNAPAVVDGFTGTGSSGGSGWYATRATSGGNQELLVYSDVKAPTRTRDFTTIYGDTPVEGSTTLVQYTIPENTNTMLAASGGFPTNGDEDDVPLTVGDDGNGNPTQTAPITGSYHGASGRFVCTGTADCVIDHVGGNTYSFEGAWTFQTSKSSKVTDPDERYMHFGWWRQQTSTGFSYSVFSGTAPDSSLGASNDFVDNIGTADYVGPAIGHYAIFSRAPGATSSHGEFKATARLTANFVSERLSGNITDFDVNPDWVVTLRSAVMGTNGVVENGDVSWSIDGTANNPETLPNWTAAFHSETPDFASHHPEGVTGTFRAQYGTVGEMRGAYGAHRQ